MQNQGFSRVSGLPVDDQHRFDMYAGNKWQRTVPYSVHKGGGYVRMYFRMLYPPWNLGMAMSLGA